MSLHDDLTRVIEDARDHSRKDFNVVKESYGQYLARVVLASGVIAKVRAEEREKAAGVAEDAPGTEASGYYSGDHQMGYQEAQSWIADRIREQGS